MPNPTYQGAIKPTGLKGLQGLRGWNELSQEEQSSWLESHPHVKNYSPMKQSIAYRNNNYLEALGQPAFESYDIETLGQMYQDKVVNEAFNDYYKNDSNFSVLNNLTTDGKQELLESGYLNEEENQKALDTSYKEYSKNMQEAAKFAPAAPGMGGFHWDTKEQWEAEGSADRRKRIEAIIAKDNKRKVADSQEDIDALYNYYTAEQQAWGNANNMFQQVMEGNVELSDVIDNMTLNRLITPAQRNNLLQRPIEQQANLVGEILAKSEFNPSRIDTIFDSVALPKTIEGTSEFGEVEDYQLPGSRTYNALKSTDRFKDFGASDKLKEYVTWQVLANKYGTQDAISNLETSMIDYAHAHEDFGDWASDVFLNISFGGVANIMNKINAVGNLVTEAKDGSEGLAYKLEGKNPDGSDRVQTPNAGVGKWFLDNWDNPYYWSKVDEYNTIDPLEIAQIDAQGGVSPYVTVRPPDEVVPFFSTETLKEALKMGKFVWSDYLTGRLLGSATRGLSAGASRISPSFGNVVTKAGALGTVAASGMGIAESYGVMTYEQTHQQMMEALDAKRDAQASAYAQGLLNSLEGQSEISKVVDRIAKENPSVPREEIKKSVEADFLNYHIQQYNNSDEAILSRNEDEAVARRAAANAYMVDATIEEIRMAAANFAFRKYLFDKGTRAALGDNTNYAKVASEADGSLVATNKGLQKAWNTIKPVWGGFESNYFDDVTVGFGKGFGLEQYNAWLQDKYDAGKAAKSSDYALSFLTGLGGAYEGATEALTDRQSFYDGFVGALGAPMSIMPRLSASERRETLQRMNRENATNLTVGERINKYFMNPLLDAYYEGQGKQERTDEILPIINDEIAKHKAALEDMNQVIIGLNDIAESDTSDDHLKRKDAKDRQAFRLLYVMNGLTSAPLISESSVIQNAADEIDRLAAGKATDAEINAFIAQNKSYNAEEARERIQDNAKSLKEMNRVISKARSNIENSVLGQNIDPALKEQLVYQLAMNDTWQDRLISIEETLTGKDQVNTAHSAIAAYGSKEEFDRQVNAQASTLVTLRARFEIAKEDAKNAAERYKEVRDNNSSAEVVEKARQEMLMTQLQMQTMGETIREASVKLKEMKRDASTFETEELPVLTAQQIINLNPSDRNTILNKKNRSNYSEAQQIEIDAAIAELKTKNLDAAQLVADADRLNTRIKDNKKAYRRIQDSPDAAAAYVSSINVSRAAQLTNAFAQRRVDETYKTFDAAPDNESLLALAKQALNSKELGMKSRHIDTYIKKNPEKGEALKGLSEVAKVREDAYNSINQVITDPVAKKAIIDQVVNATNDSNNGAEAMSSLESLLDIQTDATAKLQFDRVLEGLKTLGHQRDATKVRDRELERQRKQEAEAKKAAEEAKKNGDNYQWKGYKVGDTVYNKGTGNAATVIGFEGTDTMLLEVPYNNGTKGIFRYHAEKSKDSISKEKPAAKEQTPEGAIDVSGVGRPMGQNPLDSAIEQIGAEDVNLEVDGDGKVNSPSAQQQANAAHTTATPVPEADPTDQGNNIPEGNDGTISGNRWVEYSIDALREGKVQQEVPENPNSVFGKLVEWLNNNKIKLQEIIDEEFGRIISDDPNTEVKFMMMKQDDSNNPLQKILFNVIELTPQIRQKYHKEERGGVIQANGKEWLVVGTTGFDNNATPAQRKAYDTMKAPISQRRMSYFKDNSTEVYYVDPMAHTIVQNTTSGRIINRSEGQEAPRLKKVSELLQSAGMSLRQAAFGIQTKQLGEKSFATTKNVTDKSTVFPPRNVEDNRGRVFILLDTANGNRIPGMIEPTMYNTLAEDSPLKEMINSTIAQLFSTNYETRANAIKELCGYLVLGDDKNILIGTKDVDVITIKREGMPDISQKLGEKFDTVKFFKDLENANFQINVTLKTLEDADMLKMYDDSGALMTTVDNMRTAGMSYTIYMTDAAGNPIITTPIANAVPGTGKTEFKTYRSVRVNNTTYEFKNSKFINRATGEAIDINTPLGQSCLYNQAIQEGSWVPFVTKDGKEYYNVITREGKTIVISRDGLGNVEFLSDKASAEINKELQRRIENQKRLDNLEDVNLDDAPIAKPAKQDGTLTPEQIQQQAVGNFETPATEIKPQPTKEVVKEAKESQPTQAKEVISDVGSKSLTELQNTENLSTFAEIIGSEKYGDRLYDVLDQKGWGITDNMSFNQIAEILKAHNVNTEGITDVEDWINQIRDCK